MESLINSYLAVLSESCLRIELIIQLNQILTNERMLVALKLTFFMQFITSILEYK